MRTVFFAWLTDDFKDTIIDFTGFEKSFKHFHPDIDLKIFNSAEVKELFARKPWLNYCNCKASFAKELYNDYDLVVNVDADFYFFDRCEEILAGDYEVAGCANYNRLVNTTISPRKIGDWDIPSIDARQYLQGGLIASTSKQWWDDYEDASRELADKLPMAENDVLNVLWYTGKYKTKVLDGDVDFNSPNFKAYYNCAALNREREVVVKDDKLYLDGRPMRSYHVAKGNQGVGGNRKQRMHEIFPAPAAEWFRTKVLGQ